MDILTLGVVDRCLALLRADRAAEYVWNTSTGRAARRLILPDGMNRRRFVQRALRVAVKLRLFRNSPEPFAVGHEIVQSSF